MVGIVPYCNRGVFGIYCDLRKGIPPKRSVCISKVMDSYHIDGKTYSVDPADRDGRRDLLVSRLCALKTSDRQKPKNKEGHDILREYDTYDEIFRRIDDEMDDTAMCEEEDVENRCSVLEETMKDVMVGASHLVDVLRDMGAAQEAVFIQKEVLQKHVEAEDVFQELGLLARFGVPELEITAKSFKVVMEEGSSEAPKVQLRTIAKYTPEETNRIGSAWRSIEASKLQPGRLAEVPAEHTTQVLNADADS